MTFANVLRTRSISWLAAFTLSLALSSCHPATQSTDDEEENAPANPTMSVTAVRAEVMPMQEELNLLGKTVATHHVIIRAPTAGRVTGMKLVTGDWVNRGQVVAHVINREIEAAEAGLAVAQKIDPDNAKSLAHSVDRYTHSAGIPVRAPDSGIVSQPPVTSGQIVGDLDPIADLIDPRSLYVEASVPLTELHELTPGMAASVFSPMRPRKAYPARMVAVLPNFDSATASSTVRLDFASSERILEAGSPVTVHIVTERDPAAISIPQSALFQDPGNDRFHVFTVGPDKYAHRTDVTVGIHQDKRVQVTSGIHPGDLVITSGGYTLSDGLRVEVAQDK
jgi:multidrug efflux pump subunit AcrA (membrane-fusion protein)